MKKYNAFNLVVLVIVMFSCTSPKGNYLPEIKVDIPQILKGDDEVLSFIENGEIMLNDYSNALESIVVSCTALVEKEESELNAIEKEQLGESMMNLTEALGMFAVKTAEMEANYTALEYSLDEEQLPAFNQVMLLFSDRILLIDQRYSNFGLSDDQIE